MTEDKLKEHLVMHAYHYDDDRACTWSKTFTFTDSEAMKKIMNVEETELEHIITTYSNLGFIPDIHKQCSEITSYMKSFTPTAATLKSSQALGVVGEEEIGERLTNLNMQWMDMSKTPHAGDFHVIYPNKHTVVVDVKNYTKAVNSDELDKLFRDMNPQGLHHGA